MKILKLADNKEWQSYVDKLPESLRDVHFLPGMMTPYETVGLGEGSLCVDGYGQEFMICPYLKCVDNVIRHPYNFGGPIGTVNFAGLSPPESYECILNPFLWEVQKNFLHTEPTYIKDVIWVDLTKEFKIRGTTRRLAERTDVEILITPHNGLLELFNLYSLSMKRHNAAPHWCFPYEWFLSLQLSMLEHTHIVLAYFRQEIVAAALLLHGYGTCYYHFAAMNDSPPKGTSHKLVLTSINWAKENGFKRFHLGGGLKPNDGLFTFKSGFSDLRLPVYKYRS